MLVKMKEKTSKLVKGELDNENSTCKNIRRPTLRVSHIERDLAAEDSTASPADNQ